MDKATRNAIERATQQGRRLLDEDFSSQLEGTFDVLRSGVLASSGGAHLSAPQQSQRDKIVAAIEHKRAAGMPALEAVTDYVRDAAFTTLNRFIALKMLEARELVQECITKGEQSAGYREFCGMAPGIALLPDAAGYRLYIESLFDEFSTEIKVLFDRRDAASVLWPKRQTFEALLAILNGPDLSGVWGEDETIGWVYQFFNSREERQAMRDPNQGGSQAPRNSREMAVRNQFFTPRYVVQFLTDNTLGRLWLEMHGEKTRLNTICEYFVPSADEPVQVRARKDPRDLRVLDPACGSGHFLLYSFDLLLTIYEEAWATEKPAPTSEATGRTLREDYPDIRDLRHAAPKLIVEHNLYGVDIDPRCAQIAALALWLRAQRAWKDLGASSSERVRIHRTHIVVAEPMPGDAALVDEFAVRLDPPLLRDLFKKMVSESRLAGELGVLLRIEDGIAAELSRARQEFAEQREKTGFLPGMEPPARQGVFDLSGIDDDGFFHEAEARIIEALRAFAETATGGTNVRRRLFAGDAAQGIAFIDICRQRYDVVLMNPPFGEPSLAGREYIYDHSPSGKADIGAAFVEVFSDRICFDGSIGVLLTRALLFHDQLDIWREQHLLGGRTGVTALADLGYGVLDAVVEVAAFCVAAHSKSAAVFIDCLGALEKADGLSAALSCEGEKQLIYFHSLDHFRNVPLRKMAYSASDRWLAFFRRSESHPQYVSRAGLASGDDEELLRAWWEVDPRRIGQTGWRWFAKGGDYGKYQTDLHLVINWRLRSGFRRSGDVSLYGRPGITYTERTTSNFSSRVLNRQTAFSYAGPAVIPHSEVLAPALLAYANSFAVAYLVEIVAGGGDYSVRGSAARHFYPSYLERLPELSADSDAVRFFADAIGAVISAQRELTTDETHIEFSLDVLNASRAKTPVLWAHSDWRKRNLLLADTYAVLRSVEMRIAASLDLGEDHWLEAYPFTGWPWPTANASHETLRKYYLEGPTESSAILSAERNRFQNKLSHWLSRDVETAAHASGCSPESVCLSLAELNEVPGNYELTRIRELLGWIVGCCFGRFDIRIPAESHKVSVSLDPFDPLPPCSPGMLTGDDGLPFEDMPAGYPITIPHDGILVDDPGHRKDFTATIRLAFDALFGGYSDVWWNDVTELLEPVSHDLRIWLASRFFGDHLRRYTKSRRKAPLLWQLGTTSCDYSVWLYAHRLTRDTFFQLQNDVVGPKLEHEERRHASLVQSAGGSPPAAERKVIAAQQSFVDELRAMLDEVKRVAPMWNPNWDDGIIINFAPLWRLVPHQKDWQKDLKDTWDGLCAGEHDWAHIAMHLWPERVIPKCATDRSLAIAHGLEDIFWVEGDDGKWRPRPTPTRSVAELVRERTSVAVKAALKSLLEAPVANANGGRGRGRRFANAAPDGGAR